MDALTKHLSDCPPLEKWLSGQKCHFYDRAAEAKFVGMIKVEECEELCKKKAESGVHMTSFGPGTHSSEHARHPAVFSVLGQELNPAADLRESETVNRKTCRTGKASPNTSAA